MKILNTLLNILWFILGGWSMFLLWCLAGVIMVLTLIGIPFARACFRIGIFSAWPFGYEVANRAAVTGREDIGTGSLGVAGNIIWLILAGWWLALAHIIAAVLFCLTLIGIPFGLQHIKLAQLSLMPIGKTIVPRNRQAAAAP